MSYATQQDMIDRFEQNEIIQLTDTTNSGVIDAAVLAKALSDADAQIDGYLVSRYTLPLATVPKSLVRFACDITRYYLYDDAATDEVRRRFEDAVKFLNLVAQGKLSFGPDANQVPTLASGGPQATGDDRTFNKANLADYNE
jgi:phage gp36-like protein